MNAIDFVNKVREMRTTQKAWFKEHLRADLIKSKQLEAEVDKALREGVTVYATATLETLDGIPTEGEQIGMFLDENAEQRPTDGEGEQA